MEEFVMLTARKKVVAIFVDRSNGQWVVRDSDGQLWVLPESDNPWDDRLPFEATEQIELEPVPGHYRYALRLPF
jgi:hypothetical protein